MYEFYKYNRIPEERIQNSSNASLYTIRFKDLAKKSFYLMNDRLYYIKHNNSQRFKDGSFEDLNKVELKKIPYIFEVLPILDSILQSYGHIQPHKLSKILLHKDFLCKV